MCNAKLEHAHAPFEMGEEVDVEYLGICSGTKVYIVHKSTDWSVGC